MNKNLQSSSKLTEFAPLSPEANQPGVGLFLSKFFKFNKTGSLPESSGVPIPIVSSDILSNSISDIPGGDSSDWQATDNLDDATPFRVDVADGRSLPNVLKRISNLLALKSTGLQAYKDTDFKQYWMPDSVSKECYDCGEKFTTFRRRHHCRVCGQIFCSRCCNQEIPGKIMGCTGDLRVCTYCCKVVLSYLQSSDMGADLSADLRSLQEDLQTKFGSIISPSVSVAQGLTGSVGGNSGESQEGSLARRKPSVGFQEDRFALGRAQGAGYLSMEERCQALQKSASLRALFEDLCQPNSGLSLQTHRYRLRNYHTCFLGSELVDWLLAQSRAATRVQATAMGQALMEGDFLECIAEQVFTDGYALYRLRPLLSPPQRDLPSEDGSGSRSNSEEAQEPPWVKQLTQQDSMGTDSESECQVSEKDDSLSLPSSSSTFYLDLNVVDSTVTLSRPRDYESVPQPKAPPVTNGTKAHDCCHTGISSEFLSGTLWLQDSEPLPEAPQPQLNDGEQRAFTTLSKAFEQHESSLLKQLLNVEGLSQSWAEVLLPLVHRIVETVQPDVRNDADDMDIRQYVQFKKVSGGSRSESCIVSGVVCTKNVAHRAMATRLTNPRILLLGCSIVYQRIEGRLLSLEPVMMQEREYLRHVVARIEALHPHLVLVQRNVSRLAQEFLLALGVTLVLNVKSSVLERVARCTMADIVSSVDAHIGRPQLGSCRSFYLQTFATDKGGSKTLMFLEGCSSSHLGCTVLLRGASSGELARLKRVANQLVFAHYSWRLEKAFLMDEFARPPSPPTDAFFEEHGSPVSEGDKREVPGVTDSKTTKNETNTVHSNLLLKQNLISKMEKSCLELSDSGVHVSRIHGCDVEGNTKTIGLEVGKNSRISGSGKQQGTICSVCGGMRGYSQDSSLAKVGKSQSEECRPTFSNVETTLVSASETVDQLSSSREMGEHRSVSLCLCRLRSRTSSKDKSPSEEKRMNVESVSDFSDPLHSYLNLDDEVFGCELVTGSLGEQLAVSELPLSNRFRKALDDTILSSSPYLKFTVPYLETDAGRSCVLWRYFPYEIFWSAQFSEGGTSVPNNLTPLTKLNNIKLLPQHPFVSAKLTSCADAKEIQTLLAHFRACGGRVMPAPCPEIAPAGREEPVGQVARLDALDPASHQHITVLFCSYAHESSNAPAFCVNPWVVHMDFYGRNDIPLGSFLERYCFRPSYVCPSETCDTPMLEHVRRFVHELGCVHILLKELDRPIPRDGGDIHMWSWCSRCKMVSPVVPMSSDTWSLSFAKFLELRFHGYMYTRRGLDNTCQHSLHHDHLLYFGFKNVVASFKYTDITLWEVSLPPPVIVISYDAQQQVNVIEEIKKLALKGYDVYSCILERLCSLGQEVEVGVLKQQLQREQAHYKSRIEEIQLKLTSPTLEAKKLEGKVGEKDVQQLMWHIEDSVVQVKRLISELVTNWNARLLDLVAHSRKRDERHRKSEGSKTATHTMSMDCEEEVAVEATSPSSEGHEDDTPSPSGLTQVVVMPTGEVLETDAGSMVPESEKIVPEEQSSPKLEVSGSKPSASGHHGSAPIQYMEVIEDVASTSVPPQAPSPKMQMRSQSDSIEDSYDGKPAQKIKTILSQLLPSTGAVTPIQSPLSPQEHHLVPAGCSVPVVVYETEPSSIIAYAMSSQEYRRGLEDLRNKQISNSEIPTPSPVHKRKSGISQSERDNTSDTGISTDVRRSGVLSFLRGSSTSGSNSNRSGVLDGVQYSTSGAVGEVGSAETEDPASTVKSGKAQPSLHIEVQFSDTTSNFFCRVYFVEQFANLRQAVLSVGEEGFVRSLSRCVQWAARGGKSGSSFCKTRDDRFVLKEMSRLEMQLFLDFAPHYFSYVQRCLSTCQPTLLGKIVGVYRIKFRNATSNTTLSSNLLVMENLFYSRSVTHKFDLKGSVRNRLVNPAAEREGEIVLLDENLLKMTCDSPLYIYPHSKTVLMQAINNDTQFLASQSVMDYSLLVGLDQARKELVVGIIDYIRTFTWDKKLEAMVKYYGNIGGQGKLPTVVSPELYRARFIAAMHRYFLPVPDRWTGLGKGLDC